MTPKNPSPAAPSPCAPSSNITADVNAGGEALVTIRWNSVTVTPFVSSRICAVIVTASVDFGTNGKCFASRISGAALFVATEFATPGDPCSVTLAAQFCPALLGSLGLINSSDLPPPSASSAHVQPSGKNGERMRTAQSPSSAYST